MEIADILVPLHGDGAELARQVDERWPGLPILFMSGFSDTAAIDATGLQSKVLRKLFRIGQVLREIDGLLPD